jgi:hypothetical protein
MRAARGTRMRSGRLKTSERKRRLNAANPKPGEVVILDHSRRSFRGQRSRGSWNVDLAVRTQCSVDMDVRKLVHAIRVNLGLHFRAALLGGQKADGKGSLPRLKGGESRAWGVESGFLANNWSIGPIRGGSFAATCVIQPNGADGRSFMISRNLARGVDLQAIDGAAAEVIRRTTEEWLRVAAPADGDGVATPARIPTRGGTLPEVAK